MSDTTSPTAGTVTSAGSGGSAQSGRLLEGRCGLVTGAAGGIGRGVALDMAREGAAVVVSDLESSRKLGEETVSLIHDEGGRAEFAACDVSDPEQAQALVDTTLAIFGRLDFAVNNAGVAVVKPLADMLDEDFDLVINVNLRGVFNGMRAQLQHMVGAGGGAIVNTGSVASVTAVRNIGTYTASKHGILGLTKNAAQEYGDFGIRVNCVCPNAIRTPLVESAPEEFVAGLIAPQALKRLGEPAEVGAAVSWLCSEKASFVTGVALPVDGGYLAGP